MNSFVDVDDQLSRNVTYLVIVLNVFPFEGNVDARNPVDSIENK